MIELIGDSLKQWEQGRQVKITTEEPYNEVHVAQIGDANALVVEPKDNTANIPNILLQEARKLVVYLVYKTSEGETVQEMSKFNVEQRPKPSDYVYTETEVKNFEQLEARIEQKINGLSTELTQLKNSIHNNFDELDNELEGFNKKISEFPQVVDDNIKQSLKGYATEEYAKSVAATFVAQYRVTPFADIKRAYDDGKLVVLVEKVNSGTIDCVRTVVHATASTIYFGRMLASLNYIDEVVVTSADVWKQTQTKYATPDQVPIVKHIVTSKAGSFKCQPNTTYTLYCTDGEATIHGYGAYNQDTDGSQLELSAKSLSVSCGGIADTYTLPDGTTVTDKNSDRAKFFATGVDTGILTPSINVRRGTVMHSSDTKMQTHYALISYPAECTIVIQANKGV